MTFTAIGFRQFGGPEVLTMFDFDEVEPSPGEIRVTSKAATVNPTDTLSRSGALGISLDVGPVSTGMDFAGVVSAVAPGSKFKVGDEVVGVLRSQEDPARSAYASEVIVAETSVVPKPAGVDFVHAASFMMNGLTALMAIDLLEVESGATIGITGGAGAVGGFAIEIAKARGLTVIADAFDSDADLIKRLGADVVIARGDGVIDRFVEANGGPLDGIVDAALIGPELAAAVKSGGGLAVLRPANWELEGGVRRVDVAVPYYFPRTEKLAELAGLVESGAMTLRVARTYLPEEAAQAHRDLEAGGIRGRLVIEWP